MTSWLEIKGRFREVHGDLYRYNLQPYTIQADVIQIWCRTCYEYFPLKAVYHLRGTGCPTCRLRIKNEPRLVLFKEAIRRSKEIHGDKYVYLRLHKRPKGKLRIYLECAEHGCFDLRLVNHMKGHGCPSCALRALL